MSAAGGSLSADLKLRPPCVEAERHNLVRFFAEPTEKKPFFGDRNSDGSAPAAFSCSVYRTEQEET